MSKKGLGLSDEEALRFHAGEKPGKLEIRATKPMATQRDLSLAYSPGVAVPVKAIAENPELAFDYTSRGNMVAVISNGTAILGLGNLGALASKPVMEGKSVLFKRFADVDSIDLEVDTADVEEFINSVKYLGPSFGGINLEDIKAPDCFVIESRLREEMDIPVFHDDQHGTAIICVAGMLNALHLAGKDIKNVRVVMNGAGAAGIACLELLKALGLPHDNAILCDTKGVIYQGRTEGMNQWKSAHAAQTDFRTLEEALKGADIFLGLSVKGAVTPDMVKSMASHPIIFAMANPDPEITPEEVAKVRDDAIVATGRSDYPNQVNNVLGFPYIFRGALDVRATRINDAMKIAAAEALAELAREEVPDEVAMAYDGPRPSFSSKYIIPVPFDPRLIYRIPMAVARAAMETGVAKKPIEDFEVYENKLKARLDPTSVVLESIYAKVKRHPKRVVFAEGENESVLRAAVAFQNNGLGTPIVIADAEKMRQMTREANISPDLISGLIVVDKTRPENVNKYLDFVYSRLQRRGYVRKDCERLLRSSPHVLGACMTAIGDADALVTGMTTNTQAVLDRVRLILGNISDQHVMGVSLVVAGGKTKIVSDTLVSKNPNGETLANIAKQSAIVARRLGIEPHLGLISYSSFGNPEGSTSEEVRDAVNVLNKQDVDFEFDGEMSIDVALNENTRANYPFCHLKENANVLVMPGIHSAVIATSILRQLGGATVIGPLLVGLEASVQLIPMGSSVSDIVNMAAFAAYNLAEKE
ncbi:MAG: NADP-dependent malic enzyme [Pseudomonadota bacterium]